MARIIFVIITLLLLGCGNKVENKTNKVSSEVSKTNEVENDKENQKNDFASLLERANMSFVNPDEFKEIEPIENDQMNWEKAFKHPTKKFEVRYAIRPMDNVLNQHQKKEDNKKEGDVNIHPNKWYESTFQMTVLNISGGQFPEHTIFPSQAVKKDFNADWGATTTVSVGEEFGQGYKHCLFVFIHKDDLGQGYIFYLADDVNVLMKEMYPIFRNLKFK